MRSLYRWVIAKPWWVAAGGAGLTAFFGAGLLWLRLDSSVSTLLPSKDPGQIFYDRTVSLFGSDEVNVIGVIADDVFSTSVLEKIDRITRAAEKIDGVAWVMSITNVKDPIADVVSPPRLMPEIPRSRAALEELRRRVEDNPLFVGNLVSADSRGAAINVYFRGLSDAEYIAKGIDRKLEELIERERGPEEIYLTGLAHIKTHALELMRRDLVSLAPVSLVLVMGVLFLAFRTKRGVLFPLGCVVLGVAWTLGLMGWLGEPITIGTLVLPPVLVVIGSSYATHMLARYYLNLQSAQSRDPRAVAQGALEQSALPLFVSALTTMVGFCALTVNPIQAVRALGLFAVIGIGILFCITMTLMPAALALLPAPPPAEHGNPKRDLGTVLGRLAEVDITMRAPIFAAAVAIALVSLVAIPRIVADTSFLSYFPPQAPVRVASERVNRHVAGAVPFYVVLQTPQPKLAVTHENLQRIRDFQDFLESIPGVETSISIVDYLELLDRGLREGAEDFVVDEKGNLVSAGEQKSFWEAPERLGEVLNLVSGNPSAFRSVVTDDFSAANIIVRTSFERSSEIAAAVRKIENWGRAHLPPTHKLVPTGKVILLNNTTDDVVWGQVESVTLALIVIFLVMSVLFLSLKVGFVAMLPNILPIVAFFGLMGWAGVELNIGTSIIAAIAIGIAVDNTIHYVARFTASLKETGDQERAIASSLSSVGRPIVYTSAALACGFLGVCFSTFAPLQSFGFLSAATLGVAALSNLIFLPALLATTRIVTIWDLLFVKLGRDPHRTIPLLKGLRGSQARIAVLMGHLEEFKSGSTIVEQGTMGEQMFVILRGTAEVRASARPGGPKKTVRRLGRGDVFGEMGLVRRHPRSADVVALEDVEVLAMDESFLTRLQRRYPRIAAKVFLNLARILSDRLEGTTELAVGRAAAEG